jgi:ribosomal protein S14
MSRLGQGPKIRQQPISQIAWLKIPPNCNRCSKPESMCIALSVSRYVFREVGSFFGSPIPDASTSSIPPRLCTFCSNSSVCLLLQQVNNQLVHYILSQQNTRLSFSFWAYGFICGWPRPVSSRSAKQPGWRSPPIVTIFCMSFLTPLAGWLPHCSLFQELGPFTQKHFLVWLCYT